MRTSSKCSIEGCDHYVHSKGWCNKHYLRWYHYGDAANGSRANSWPHPQTEEQVPLKVLDKGCLILADHMGNDKTVANAARVSYANASWSGVLMEKDERLIRYLAAHKHVSPFYHPQLAFIIKAPISVQRQADKHKIGTASNSESTRYTEVKPEFYLPAHFREQSSTNKQGSGKDFDEDENEVMRYRRGRQYERAWAVYDTEIKQGVAREQARDVLPLATYTSWYWTLSLLAAVHFIELRDAADSQYEIREYAKAMRSLVEPIFPVSLNALLK